MNIDFIRQSASHARLLMSFLGKASIKRWRDAKIHDEGVAPKIS